MRAMWLLSTARVSVLIMLISGLFLLFEFCTFRAIHVIEPRFSEGVYRYDGDTAEYGFAMPFYLDPGPLATFHVTTAFTLPTLHPTVFHFLPDDCLDGLTVNGRTVFSEEERFCDYQSGKNIDLAQYLVPGRNTLTAVVRNTGWPTGLRVDVSPVDPLRMSLVALAVAGTGVFLALIFRLIRPQAHFLRCTEISFLSMFLILKVLLFLSRRHQAIGYDIGPHLEMFWHITWHNPFLGVRDYFLSYHPPLAFLFAKTLYMVGGGAGSSSVFSALFGDAVLSIQWISMLSLLIVFFCTRKILRELQLLESFSGIAFLYFFASIPLLVHMSTSMNLDAIVFAFTSITLYCSFKLFPREGNTVPLRQIAFYAMTVVSILLALFTKFSGIITASIPVLVAASAHAASWKQWRRHLAVGFSAAIVALALASPYYYIRYYQNEHTFFPSNAQWVISEGHRNAVLRRDQDRMGFVRQLFTPHYPILFPTYAWIGTARSHDFWMPHLSNTWADVWIADPAPIAQMWESVLMSLRYLQIMPWFVIAGAWLFLFYVVLYRDHWTRMGMVLLPYGCLQIAALALYVYQNPDAGFKPTKAIYIAPITWVIAYLIVTGARCPLAITQRWKSIHSSLGILMLALVAYFMVMNHVMPVY